MHKLLGHLEKHQAEPFEDGCSSPGVTQRPQHSCITTSPFCEESVCFSGVVGHQCGPASCTRRVLPGVAVLASGPRCAVNRGFDTLHCSVIGLLFRNPEKGINNTQSNHLYSITQGMRDIGSCQDSNRGRPQGAITLRTCRRRKCSMCEAVQNCSGRFLTQTARSSRENKSTANRR